FIVVQRGRGRWGGGDLRAQALERFWEALEIADDQGRPLTRAGVQQLRPGWGASWLSLTYLAGPEAGLPAQIRLYDYTRTTTEIAFEFHDIPLP
ncbi:MAG: hypothetical protein IRY99_26785, partial [Isosphaeraceae bacterium]|nr:hypothetical protein [Isosphaeraceae bacterium]